MKTVNKVTLLGNVGKDPEVRSGSQGAVIVNLSLATSDRQKDKDGNWTDNTVWHNLVAFGKTGEVIRDLVKKGTKLYVEGRIQTRSWDDKTSGEKKYRTEIVVNELTLLSGKPEAENHGYSNAREVYSNPKPITDEDIPF